MVEPDFPSYNDQKMGQGRDKAREFLKENPDTLKEIDTRVRETLAAQRAALIEENKAALDSVESVGPAAEAPHPLETLD